MKSIIRYIMSEALIAGAAACLGFDLMAASLTPGYCSVGETPFVRPLEWIELYFNCGINFKDSKAAIILYGGEEVAKSVSAEIYNYRIDEITTGIFIFNFERQNLPRGKRYELVVPEGMVTGETDATLTNDEIRVWFEIPEDLGPASFEYDDYDVIDSESSISCYWRYETFPVGEPEWILYREDLPVRRVPANVTWDWDLGQAHFHINGGMRFEKGVKYTLVLPEGSACTYREDIVNRRETLHFIGGCNEPIPAPRYSWCSLYTERPTVVEDVMFYFDMPITLIEDRPINLLRVDGETLIKSVIPTLKVDAGKYVVTASFGGVDTDDYGGGYVVEIPAGTVVTAKGDVAVNAGSCVSVEASSAERVSAESPVIRLAGRELSVDTHGETVVRVCGSDGIILCEGMGHVTVTLPEAGIYVVETGGTVRKISVR